MASELAADRIGAARDCVTMHTLNAENPAPAVTGSGAREIDQLGRQINSEANLTSVRFQHLVGHLHRLGPRPLSEFLKEIEAGGDLYQCLEVYGRLPVEFVHALGGDVLPIDKLGIIDGGSP